MNTSQTKLEVETSKEIILQTILKNKENLDTNLIVIAIKDNLYDEIANNPQITADIEEHMDDQKNLGLTQKDIRELEGILEEITTEETGEDYHQDLIVHQILEKQMVKVTD